MIPHGRQFFKMSGSGNDFIMFDARTQPPGRLADADQVRLLCARGTGIGADGIVFLLPSGKATVRMVYLNADGSVADLCGNATLCTTRLAVELGAAPAGGMTIETDAGVLAARLHPTGPEFDLPPVTEVREAVPDVGLSAGERRAGFARAGVPHLAVLVDDVTTVDVVGRGRPLRSHPSLRDGANVNFIQSLGDGRLRMRTYERGVEAETLACGTGAVSVAVLATAWGLVPPESPVRIRTSSGRELSVRFRPRRPGWNPSLSGQAVLIFSGHLGEPASEPG